MARKNNIRIPGYVPVEAYWAQLLATNSGWIIGTLLYHWLNR